MERSLSETFKKIDNETLLLPDFQRDYKWGAAKQQNLLSSILLKFPVGSSLILEGKASDFALRKIGETVQHTLNTDKPCEYLLDGQQRTTTLYNAFNDVFDFSTFKNQSELTDFISKKANPMKARWFIRIPLIDKKNEKVTDIFNARELIFNKETLDNFEPNDIYDIFECVTFNEKNNKGSSKWFSPYYQLKLCDSGKTQPYVVTQLVNDCIANGMIPLFMLGTNSTVVKRVIAGIADYNLQAIRDSVEAGSEEEFNLIKSRYDINQAFDGIDNIASAENQGIAYTDEVKTIFDTCKNEWKNNVLNYLLIDIYRSYQLNSLVTNDITRAIPIFCHLNEGGMKLDDFDLVSAKVAKILDGDTTSYSLSSIIRSKFIEPIQLCTYLSQACNSTDKLFLNELDTLSDGLPSGYFSKSILSICTILARREIENMKGNLYEVKKNDTSSKTLINLDAKIIRKHIERAILAVQRAFAFLLIKCGVSNASKLHYKLMIQPIAYIFSEDVFWQDQTAHKKIEYWYWTSAFAGRYLYDQSAVVIEDLNQLYNWVKNDIGSEILSRESKIFQDDKYSSKKLLMQEMDDYPRDGIHNFILQYVLSAEPSYDLVVDTVTKLTAYSKNTENDVILLSTSHSEGLNDHHIIPLGVVKSLGQKTEVIRNDPNHILNSPLNRVLISRSANNIISSMPPSQYFDGVQKNKNVMRSLLINDSFRDISTSSTNNVLNDIKNVLSDRFDILEQSIQEKLLNLRT